MSISLDNVKKVQVRLLEMAKAVSGILERHDIPYIIFGGSLLGAVRHGGFIPWDDDFDFCLFDESYEWAMDCLREELPSDMFLEDEKSEPLYFHGWAHVKDVYTIVDYGEYPQDNSYRHKGLSLDLYRLTKVKVSELAAFHNEQNRAYILRRREKGLIDDEEYKNRIKRLEVDEEYARRYPETDKEEVYTKTTGGRCKKYRISYILPLRRYAFEDTQFWGPHNGESLLGDLYGDFMAIPPKEQQISHISGIRFLRDDGGDTE